MTITEWPTDQRPRERLLAGEAARLSDAELLAVLLRTGMPGRSAVDLGNELLAEYGGLRGLLSARQEHALARPGLGPARWALLQASVELSRRSLREELRARDSLQSPGTVRDFLALWLRDRGYEIFAGLFLDSQNRLISAEELFRGTLTQTAVYPREVARRALELNCAAIIFAHNHPSGVAEPSAADRMLTDALRAALRPLDIPVLDHLIVAGNRCYSFAEAGLL
ncbi:DNA repair protein RadC [Burkholderiaceae bacterium FT117]|uniref:RadC family protein n=1 Tax=Zeimonas sediminis TaxID=2944268 RepID=UPI0023430D5B|nr:DNA repair protein RadC [Zeimonas sediminis]MCM5572242.1 DNA repair protein RadC [Zeimonas sediminis]